MESQHILSGLSATGKVLSIKTPLSYLINFGKVFWMVVRLRTLIVVGVVRLQKNFFFRHKHTTRGDFGDKMSIELFKANREGILALLQWLFSSSIHHASYQAYAFDFGKKKKLTGI